MNNLISNPDILNHVNPVPTHTSQIGFSSTSVGGKRMHKSRRYKSRIHKSGKHKSRRHKSGKHKSRRHKIRRHKSRRHKSGKHKSRRHKIRRHRRQHGGVNPSYRSYSTSLEPGHNGIYANGPSVGKIIEKYD